MTPSGNSDSDPSPPNPLDRWDALLKGIADDVHTIRHLVVMSWWAGWIVLSVVVALAILIS